MTSQFEKLFLLSELITKFIRGYRYLTAFINGVIFYAIGILFFVSVEKFSFVESIYYITVSSK